MISVVLPFYQRQGALNKSLESYRKHYRDLDLEIVIVDDGSPTICSVGSYPWPVRIIRLPTKYVPLNPCIPFNEGVREARGEVIVLSNPETIHESDVFSPMLGQLHALWPDGYVLAAAWCPEEDKWHCHSSISGDRPSGEKQPAGSGFHFCAMLYRSLWNKAGGFDESYRDGAGYDDPDWVNRLAQAGAKFCIRDDLVVIHPKTGAQTMWPPGSFDRNRALFMKKWQS